MQTPSNIAGTMAAVGLVVALTVSPIGNAAVGQKDDAALESEVRTFYSLSDRLRAYEVDAHARDGEVRLTGTVGTATERELAAEIAAGVKGVRSVRNDIRVAGESGLASGLGAKAADAAITARVKSRLLWNSYTDGLDISVATRDKHVVLGGSVNTDAEAELAQQIARNTEGVTAVTSELVVAPSPIERTAEKVARTTREATTAARGEIDDAWISAKATAVVMSDSRFLDTRVDIRTAAGVVTLAGSVSDQRQRSALIDAVSQVVGVRSVVAQDLAILN